MDSNWLPGLLGEGDDIRSFRPTPHDSEPPPANADEGAATSTETAGAETAGAEPSAEAGADDGDATAEATQPLDTLQEATEPRDVTGAAEPLDELDEAASGAGPGDEAAGTASSKRARNGGMPRTTDAFARWSLPPVRRVETRRRKPVDPDKLPSYLRGHPRFER